MDDWVTYSILATSAFFAILSVGLLFRYSQVSKNINASTDLGKDLWDALDSRLKKQDERIIDMMGRVEVIQERAVGMRPQVMPTSQGPPIPTGDEVTAGNKTSQAKGEPAGTGGKKDEGNRNEPAGTVSAPQKPTPESADTSPVFKAIEERLVLQDETLSRLGSKLDSIQFRLSNPATTALRPQGTEVVDRPVYVPPTKVDEKILLGMLAESPKSSVEIRAKFGISREHAARLLKELFERNLVVRNDTHKPFVYELTEQGRAVLDQS